MNDYRKSLLALVGIAATLFPCFSFAETPKETLTVVSRDGTHIHGVIDLPEIEPIGTVVLVPGTGLVDRDLKFEKPDGSGGKLFLDMAQALTARGLAVIRYDIRGAIYNEIGAMKADRALAATATVENKTEDLRAIYDEALRSANSARQCLVLVGFSEGMRYIAGLAETGTKPPSLVLGMGAMMSSPVELAHWQKTRRLAAAIRRMDVDKDGAVSEAELEKGWRESWMFDVDPRIKRIRGPLTDKRLSMLSLFAEKSYALERDQALALNDSSPFPDAANATASAQWWKMWFSDHRAVADRLAAWDVPVSLHYGERDSQLVPPLQIESARSSLGERVTVRIHPALGHALGDNAFFGPMNADAEKILVDDIASAAQQCQKRSART